jgi:hypothetical protein
VVRFWNNDVLANIEGVYLTLIAIVDGRPPHPTSRPQAAAKSPSPTRGEGKHTRLRNSGSRESGGAV